MVAILVLKAEAFVVVQMEAKPATTAVPLNFNEESVSNGAKFVDDHWK